MRLKSKVWGEKSYYVIKSPFLREKGKEFKIKKKKRTESRKLYHHDDKWLKFESRSFDNFWVQLNWPRKFLPSAIFIQLHGTSWQYISLKSVFYFILFYFILFYCAPKYKTPNNTHIRTTAENWIFMSLFYQAFLKNFNVIPAFFM